MPFMEGVDAICHFGTPFAYAYLGVVWTPFAIYLSQDYNPTYA
jgi:hypothetical protein